MIDAAARRSPVSNARLQPLLFAHWRLKLIAPWVGMTAFFICYFALLDHPLFAVTMMPVTAVDRWIGFHPAALYAYLSLWVYITLAPGLLDRRDDLWFYYAGVSALAVFGLTVFLLWPTASPPADIDWARYPGFQFLKTNDKTGNAFPSLHVAFAVFSAIWGHRLLGRSGSFRVLRAVNMLWCAAIVYSTLATKQHVAVDVYSGAALGAVAALLHIRLAPSSLLAARPAVQSSASAGSRALSSRSTSSAEL